jgi:FkbM family methyltransferase
MLSPLKRVAAHLPTTWQSEMRRHLYRRQILHNTFTTNEPESALLSSLLGVGNWAIDVGANVGHYTKRMSDLVGDSGRVIAFEPVAETFSLLAANVQSYKFQNVTLVNAAASDSTSLSSMTIPRLETGLLNYYEATLETQTDGMQVLTLAIDSLCLPKLVSLIKIDAEGHELSVLRGARRLLERDRPIVIIEISSREVHSFLEMMNYSRQTLPDSPNHIYRP